nr:MAG TPA: ERF superfamily protein [Caudoviricetes sp.]
MSINEKILNIQNELKAPKSQWNNFGKYNYRNAEDILEAAKPLLKKEGVILTLTDEIVLIGSRYYVKSTATVKYADESIVVSAYAREEENKKGMDGSQVTGASSSYARKYALNGLFLIDDTKDSDFTNDNQVKNNTTQLNKLSEEQIKRLYTIGNKAGYDSKKMDELVKKKYRKDTKSLTQEEYKYICESLEKNQGGKK